MRARVVIATEHVLFHDGLRSLLEAEWPVCTVVDAGTGLEAAVRATQLHADVLILDLALALNRFPHLELLRQLVRAVPTVVLFEAGNVLDEATLHGLGVRSVIDKRHTGTVLRDAIQSVLDQSGRLSRAHGLEGKKSSRRAAVPPAEAGLFDLTLRERQILALVAAAYPNKEIARRLEISEDTVKRHLTSIFDKVGVSNRVELTLFAVHHGLLADSLPPRAPTSHPVPAVSVS
jgi:two-component system, NarL family, nitrate/nitrite response regulator NarL